VAVVAFLWPRLSELMIYDRAALFGGQLWRLWTGHWVHFTLSHLAWDLLVFVAAGVWLERISASLVSWFYLLAPPAISLLLFEVQPSLARYAGLSGVATGTLTLLALVQLRRDRSPPRWFWPGVLVLVAVKLAIETFARDSLFAGLGPNVVTVPCAHYGGVACALFAFLRSRSGLRANA